MTEARSSCCRRPGLLAVGLALLALVTPIPHARADVCPGRYTVSADGTTVTDNDTHLVWQRNVDVTQGQQCAQGLAKGCYSWPAASDYCMTLPLAGGGWRLPRNLELQTIVDESRHSPAITFGSTAFSKPPLDSYYWTSTPVPDIQDVDAWTVEFRYGEVSWDKASSGLRVRCVR